MKVQILWLIVFLAAFVLLGRKGGEKRCLVPFRFFARVCATLLPSQWLAFPSILECSNDFLTVWQ